MGSCRGRNVVEVSAQYFYTKLHSGVINGNSWRNFLSLLFSRSTIEITLTVGARSYRKIRGPLLFLQPAPTMSILGPVTERLLFSILEKKKSSARAFEAHDSAFVLFI